MINVVDEYFSFFMIIIQRQNIMINWFDEKLSEDIYMMLFELKFIFDKIALKFLKRYIKHSNADSNAVEWKLMLMNNHESHIISEFIALTNENYIESFSLISHLIHCMQSLNVDVF